MNQQTMDTPFPRVNYYIKRVNIYFCIGSQCIIDVVLSHVNNSTYTPTCGCTGIDTLRLSFLKEKKDIRCYKI